MISVLFFLGLGVFYSGAKFHVPWYGGNDFAEYSLMVEAPLQNEAPAPFAYRILTPALGSALHSVGLYYDSPDRPYTTGLQSYNGKSYSSSVLSALIFANFLLLVLGAFILTETMLLAEGTRRMQNAEFLAIAVSALIFLSLSSVVHGMGGLTEGGSLFFVSLLLHLNRRRWFAVFAVVTLLSVLQRELIPIILGTYIASTAFLTGGRAELRARMPYIVACIVAFGLYLVLRKVIPIEGNAHQMTAGAYLSNILAFRPSKQFLFQGVLANNLVWGLLLFGVFFHRERWKLFVPFALVVAMLTFLGIGANIGNNLARILNLATPILLLAVFSALTPSTEPDHA